jgi:hypothetical protein
MIESIAAGTDVVVTNPNGAMPVKAVVAGGKVTLKNDGGALTDANGGATNVTAADAQLTATGGVGTSADPLETAVGTLVAEATNAGAGVFLGETDGLTSVAVKTKDGDATVNFGGESLTFVAATDLLSAQATTSNTAITFENTAGGIVLDQVNAGTGNVALTALGAISDDANDAVTDVAGGAVTLSGTAIGAAGNEIDTVAGTLNLTASAGGIFVREADAVTLNATASGAGNDVDVANAVGDLTLGNVSAPDQVTLSAAGSIGSTGTGRVSGAGGTLTAGGAIGAAGAPIKTGFSTLSATANNGGVSINNNKALALTASASGGDLSVETAGNLTLNGVLAAGQTATLSAAGEMIDGNGVAVNVTASTASLSASKIGTSLDKIETSVGTLSAAATSGGVFLTEADGLTLDIVQALGSGSDVDITAGGTIVLGTITSKGDGVVLTSTNGQISDNNGGAVDIVAKTLTISATNGVISIETDVTQVTSSGGSGPVSLTNLGALEITAPSLSGGNGSFSGSSITIADIAGNSVTLPTGASLTLTATGNVVFVDRDDTIVVPGGTITITAGGPSSGAVAIVGNLDTSGGNGDISIAADSHITVGKLNAGTGDVTLQSNTGLILDGNGADVNVIGGSLTIGGATPSADALLLGMVQAIADASAAASEEASKDTLFQTWQAGQTITGISVSNTIAEAARLTSEASTANAAVDSQADIVDPLSISKTVADGVALGLGIAADVADGVASGAQAIPLTGDGGASAVAFVLDVAAKVADVAAFALGVAVDIEQGKLDDLETDAALANAKQFAGESTRDLAIATDNAFKESLSISAAALDAARVANLHAGQVADQAIQAKNVANVVGTSAQPLGIQVPGRVDVTAGGGSVFLAAIGDTTLGDISTPNAPATADVRVTATGQIALAGAIAAPDLVRLEAANGILHNSGRITSPELLLLAGSGIGGLLNPVMASIDRFAANGGTGGVAIDNDKALLIATVDGVNGITAGTDMQVTASSDISDAAGTTVTAGGQATFSTSGDITLGDSAGDATNFGSLNVTGEDVTITEDSGTLFTGASTVTGDLVIHSAGKITTAPGTSLSVGGEPTFEDADHTINNLILDGMRGSYFFLEGNQIMGTVLNDQEEGGIKPVLGGCNGETERGFFFDADAESRCRNVSGL